MVFKRVLLCLSIIGALVISQSASADNRNHRRGYGDFGYGQQNFRSGFRNFNRGNRNFNRGNRRVNAYHYGAWDRGFNRRYRNGFNFSYGNFYPRHRRHNVSGFVGGLVVGSLLNYPRYPARNVETVVYRDAPVTRTREVVYVDRTQTRSTPAPVASGRRLLRDLQGNCFERIVDEQGDEIRVQLEAQECSF